MKDFTFVEERKEVSHPSIAFSFSQVIDTNNHYSESVGDPQISDITNSCEIVL